VGVVVTGSPKTCLQYDAASSRFILQQPASNTCNTLTLSPVAGMLPDVVASCCLLLDLYAAACMLN